jgi:hypothetical protein
VGLLSRAALMFAPIGAIPHPTHQVGNAQCQSDPNSHTVEFGLNPSGCGRGWLPRFNVLRRTAGLITPPMPELRLHDIFSVSKAEPTG